MDGLLVDTEPLWFETETEVMARLGAPWSVEDQEQLLGGSMERTVGSLLATATRPASPAEIARWMMEGMLKRAAEGRIVVRPGARELIAAVAAAGVPYALVTSSEREFADAVLVGTGFRFPVTVTADDVARTKPDPEPNRLLAARGSAHRRALRRGGRLPCRCRPVPAADSVGPRPPGGLLAARGDA